MGTITRSFANNITTSGLLLPGAFNNSSFDSVTSVPEGAITSGGMVLLSTQTASNDSSVDITSGIDSTYDQYVITYTGIRPSTTDSFKINFSSDGGSTFAVNKTNTFWKIRHWENDGNTELTSETAYSRENSTADVDLTESTMPDDADSNLSGVMYLYNPSSTTYQKQFLTTNSLMGISNASYVTWIAGTLDTTSAVNGVRFLYPSYNIASGTFKLFGIG
jgi:hypothetical protein